MFKDVKIVERDIQTDDQTFTPLLRVTLLFPIESMQETRTKSSPLKATTMKLEPNDQIALALGRKVMELLAA